MPIFEIPLLSSWKGLALSYDLATLLAMMAFIVLNTHTATSGSLPQIQNIRKAIKTKAIRIEIRIALEDPPDDPE